MKKYALLMGFVFIAGQASARVVERVLKDETTMVALELNSENVFCTELGYGSVQLKINVPELDFLAHFDHRVVGERQPCITGGACDAVNNPDSILSGDKLVAVPVRIILSESLEIDDQAKTCTRTLNENVKSHIKNKNFTHFRNAEPEVVAYEKCLKVQSL